MTREEIIEKCLDNTYDIEDREEQGLLWFGRYFFPHVIKNKYSEAHFKMSQLYFELLCPQRKTAMDRQAYMLIHREAAKSTIGTFLMPLYSIFLKGYRPVYKQREVGFDDTNLLWEKEDDKGKYNIVHISELNEKFILIASETAGQSETFVTDIKSEIESNVKLMEIFGGKHPEDIIDNELTSYGRKSTKWTKSAFLTNDNTAVVGVGSGQRVRGRKIKGSRPTFIAVDDMYSEENTKTAERREGLNQWFYNALKNSVDSETGKMLWLGTMVHPDIVAKEFKKDPLWWGIEVPIISDAELKEALSYCTRDGEGRLRLPDLKALAELNEKMTTLSWKDRYPIEHILKKYIEQLSKQKPDYFYQEYMNKPIAPESETLSPDAFEIQPSLIFSTDPYGNQQCEYKDKNQIRWKGKVNLTVGIDMASALHKKADDTAICIAGMARLYPNIPGFDLTNSKHKYPNGIIVPILAHVEGGKYDIISFKDSKAKKSVVTALVDISKRFKVDRVRIEANGQQEMSIRAIDSTLREMGVDIMIEPQYTNTEKSQRIKATLLPIFQKYKKMICVDDPKVKVVYEQLNMLTISDKDDYPDALEKALYETRIPEIGASWEEISEHNKVDFDIQEELGEDSWYFL